MVLIDEAVAGGVTVYYVGSLQSMPKARSAEQKRYITNHVTITT
jgi:hypothetical protein